MRIVLFDDNPAALLPFTYLRPSWDVNVGGMTLKEWIGRVAPQAEIATQLGAYLPEGVASPHVALNGRLLPSPELASLLTRLLSLPQPVVCHEGNEVAYAIHCDGTAEKETLPEGVTLMHAPWDIVRHLEATLAHAALLLQKGLKEIRNGVFAGEGVELPDTVITRTDKGPIIIGAGACFGSFIVLEGPLVLGERCVVRDQAVIARSSVGNVCKIGGEVEDSILDAYSNKQHYGYLGHSVVGSWVNLGAGTTTSDLKHTYGPIRIDRGAGKEETGMQFCGSFIGEGSKTAINTSLMSGTVLGVSTFVFGTVKGFVPSFTSFTSHGFIEMPYEIACTMRERMMARRSRVFTPQERLVFDAVYRRTDVVRKANGVTPGVLAP